MTAADANSSALDIGPLTRADLQAALHLSTQAGWNQVEADWSRLIDLDPAVCLAGRVEGTVVATATLARYEPAWAWVGMVLVDESMRGRGFGGQIMDAILARARELGVQSLGLDATDAGRPIYAKRGFHDLCGIDRRLLTNSSRKPFIGSDEELRYRDWSRLVELDQKVMGIDRSRLLSRLRDDSLVRVTRDAGNIVAFGFRRIGKNADQIGPVVSQSAAHAKIIIQSLAANEILEPSRKLIIDTFHGGELDSWFDSIGFAVIRRLTRMISRPAGQATLSDRRIFAAAGFELG